ncbi:cytochrome c oxidase copper chaperone 2-like [Tasmannia lanceolata]|uniref:cytochrome c oxidase copper chaperone 2-like n=1 Tax=Tasmannia lanceolata TaxID=3420 RepID=UPI004063CC83
MSVSEAAPVILVSSRSKEINKEQTAAESTPDPKPKKKICCACPDTKRLRDECIVEHGEDACTKWIEAHRQCLRSEGFKI